MSPVADVVPRQVAEPIGGPLGRRASRRAGAWSALVPVITALVSLPLLGAVWRQQPCLTSGWSGDHQFWHACFSDLPAQYQIGGLSSGLPGWLDGRATVDQPPLTAALMALLGGWVPGGAVIDQTRWYLVLWLVVITAALMTTVWLTAATRPRRLDLAQQVALSPVVMLAALLSPDAVAVVLVAAAMFAWSRGRWVSTGILLGLGILSREYVIAVLLALLLTALRRRRLPDALAAAGVSVTTVALLILPLMWLQPAAVTASWQTWWTGAAGYGSVWFVPYALGEPLPMEAVRLTAIAAWVAALAVGAVMALRSPWAPTWPQVAAVVVLVGAVLSPVVPVQAALWVLPLIALAGVSWRVHLTWAAVEAVNFVAVWLFIAGLSTPDRGVPGAWYGWLLIVRMLAWMGVAVAIAMGPREPGVAQRSDAGSDDRAPGTGGPVDGGFRQVVSTG